MRYLPTLLLIGLLGGCANLNTPSTTVVCHDQGINSTFVHEGHRYLVVDNDSIRDQDNLAALASGEIRYCTSHVTDLSRLFYMMTEFNQPIGDWDTSNVTDMSLLFQHAAAFNQPIDHWDTAKVRLMRGTFYSAKAFNQPLNSWDVSNVSSMRSMFWAAYSFNQPLAGWDISNVTDLGAMFKSAWAFNQPLNQWDTRNVSVMKWMFRDASAFNQPLDQWDTAKIDDMSGMFFRASAFDQDLTQWNVSKVVANGSFAAESGLSDLHYPPAFITFVLPEGHERYSGIGISIDKPADYLVVKVILDGGPADKSQQLTSGDKIIAIGQQPDQLHSVSQWSMDQAINAIRGPSGSPVFLEVVDRKGITKTVRIERAAM
ncbi:BspA family leucine-rich repeat surface protein [Ferrimonas kyonanensis]|uniref:BspA family leucine-rich repeat surface protein n=1 Tax=Ferrimonas kyonanensis TaxID=364763 RepID=UPI0003FC7A95|nr:BspA family leucine-rich repeat surface protein [Ferrimonas kyonanensis]